MKKFFSDFKAFAMRGNVIDMAVGVIIGGAFGKIVTSIVNDILMPLLSFLIGGFNLAALKWVIRPETATHPATVLAYGNFIQTTIDFIIIAFCIFLFVKLSSKLRKKEEPTEEAVALTKTEELLTEIRDALKKSED